MEREVTSDYAILRKESLEVLKVRSCADKCWVVPLQTMDPKSNVQHDHHQVKRYVILLTDHPTEIISSISIYISWFTIAPVYD